MGDTLHISRSVIDAIVAEAGGSSEEVCGLLLGLHRHAGLVPASTAPQMSTGAAPWMPEQVRHDELATFVSSHQSCRNVAARPSSAFEIDPVALIAAHRAARAGGPVIVGHYHSHPSGDATPSATDAAQAPPDGTIWLIVAGRGIAAWRAVRDGAVHGRFDPVELIVA